MEEANVVQLSAQTEKVDDVVWKDVVVRVELSGNLDNVPVWCAIIEVQIELL